MCSGSGAVPWFILVLVIGETCCTDKEVVRILSVYDSKHYLHEAYSRIAIEFLETRTNGAELQHAVLEVPNNDTDRTFEKVCVAFNTAFNASRPDIIFDHSVAPLTSMAIKSFAKHNRVPSVSLMCCMRSDAEDNFFDDEHKLSHFILDPPSKIWMQAIRQLVERENMTTAAIIIDQSFELERSHSLLLANLPCRHFIVHLNFADYGAIRNFTEKLNARGVENIFVVASAQNAGKALEEGYILDMLIPGQPPNWFVLTKDLRDPECTQCSEGSFITIRPKIANHELYGDYRVFLRAHRDYRALIQEDWFSEFDALYDFDVMRFFVNALVASRVLGNQRDGDLSSDSPPREPVSCSLVYTGQRSRQPTSSIIRTPPVNLMQYLPVGSNDTGILGTLVVGGETNNSIIDVRLSVVEQSVKFEVTNTTKQIGTWDHRSGLVDQHGRFPRAITDKRMRVAIICQTPFIMKTVNASKPYEGYLIELMEKIAAELKFEFDLYEVPDEQFGAMDENGEWNGLIRELIDKKADIGLAPLSVLAERENVVDFTVPYFDLVGITILMKKTNQEEQLFKFVTVLDSAVWGSILGAYVLTSLLMFLFDRYSPYSYRNLKKKEEAKRLAASSDPKSLSHPRDESKPDLLLDEYGTRIFTLKESLWFCMTSLTPQGGGEAPRNLSGRLVAATWWMFGFIIIASYTANLAAFLTVSRLETQIESLDDLTKQYGIKYAPVENSASETYFKRMWKIEERFYEIWRDMSLNESMSDKERAELAVWDYPVSDKYTKLWLTMKDFPRPRTLDEGIEWVKKTAVNANGEKEGFALISDSAILMYKANLDCDLQLVGEEFSKKPYALAVQEGSALRDQLSGVILKLLNQRELELMREYWWQTKNQKLCNAGSDENEGISIENIGGVFILVLIGTVLACIMLAFEYFWYKKRAQNKAKEDERKNVYTVDNPLFRPEHDHAEHFKADYNTDFSTRFVNDVFPDADTNSVEDKESESGQSLERRRSSRKNK